jgi:hypothetical protein
VKLLSFLMGKSDVSGHDLTSSKEILRRNSMFARHNQKLCWILLSCSIWIKALNERCFGIICVVSRLNFTYYVRGLQFHVNVQSTAHQTIHFGLCTARRALALISTSLSNIGILKKHICAGSHTASCIEQSNFTYWLWAIN